MPKLNSRMPGYCHHKASGQATVTLSGKTYYLGPYGSLVSRAEYDRLTAAWLAGGRRLPTHDELTIAELMVRYIDFAQRHYSRNGHPTKEVDNVKVALRLVRQLYGPLLVTEFGPLKLKTIQSMLAAGYTDSKGNAVAAIARRTVNARVASVKRMFKWAVSEEMAPADLAHALSTVRGLQKGRTIAREPDPIGPVDDEVVDSTLPHLPSVVADMVRFQRLVGCRPSELCGLRPCDIEKRDDIWVFTPSEHKTQHHGHQRRIFVGPRAQEILKPYLSRDPEQFCFSPSESEADRKQAMRSARKTKVQPSQRDRSKKKPRLKPGSQYTRCSYARAVARACELAFPVPEGYGAEDAAAWRKKNRWSPNRLRHAVGTEVRRKYGLEAAQVVLGHSKADVTQIYAQRDGDLAAQIMREIG